MKIDKREYTTKILYEVEDLFKRDFIYIVDDLNGKQVRADIFKLLKDDWVKLKRRLMEEI